MRGWRGLVGAADCFPGIPERWASSKGRPFEGEPRQPPRAEVRAGLEIVERALAALGPVDEDEPPYTTIGDKDLAGWARFVRRYPDRRRINGADVRAFLESIREPVPYPAERQVVSWRGYMRAWLRGQLGDLSEVILIDVPAHYEADPQGLREEAFSFMDRICLMLPDADQAAWVSMVGHRVGLRIEPIVTVLYHHPRAGPKLRRMVQKGFDDWVMERIEANVPATFPDPPWLPEPDEAG